MNQNQNFHWNVTDIPDTGYNLGAPSALSERLRRFSAHVTSSAALTSLTRSAWPFRPGSPPLVHLPARASPPAHSNTLSFHTRLMVAAFLQRRQPSSPRITARRSRATHSSVLNRPPTKIHPPGSVCPLSGQHMLSPRAKARFGRGPASHPLVGQVCRLVRSRKRGWRHAITLARCSPESHSPGPSTGEATGHYFTTRPRPRIRPPPSAPDAPGHSTVLPTPLASWPEEGTGGTSLFRRERIT